MQVTVFDPSELTPEEQVMWSTANVQQVVPSFYVHHLLRKLQEARQEVAGEPNVGKPQITRVK